MKLQKLKHFLIIAVLALFSYQDAFSQCFQIESILVDACGVQEGLNEMVRFKVGNTAINTSNMSVSWPNNPWQGLIRNSVTAAKVATLNADILDAGGCGQLIEPTGGVLPANASVILVTSHNFDTDLNSFGALTDNVYIIFQNNPTTVSGHFANSGTGIRTLTISFGSCSDTVSYDRALLIDTNGATVPADGAIVQYTPAGAATYINNGCSAPVPPFTVDAGPATMSACAGTTISLNGIAQGYQSVRWSATSGTFSTATNLSTTYTSSASQAGTVVAITLTATNSCGLEIRDTINLTLTNSTTPNFPTVLSLCNGSTAPVLNTTSPNGISGTWNPAIVSNTASGNYVFTPNAGQCASSITLSVTVTNSITPNFPTALSLCTGSTAPVLNTTSPNGISGTWNPAVVSNTASGNYVFTPNAGQCATNMTLNVTVSNSITPNFPTTLSICTGSTAPVLNATSPNGITGTWNPAVVSNTASGSYVFTPNAGQCATNMTLNVTVTNGITPNFPTTLSICTGSTAPLLNATSPNGITGTWNPAVVSNTASGSYVFTPNAGQCGTSTTLNVTVTNSIIPDFATELALCNGDGAPALATTSPNGITGTWNPAIINNTTSGSYVFTPNAGQCASNVTLNVTVGQLDFKVDNGCEGGNYRLTVVPISDFDSNDVDYEWKNNQGIRVGTDSSLNVTELLNSTPVEEEFPITYTVQVTTAQGCTLTREETVYGIFCSIPKGISPNNDGKNDEFDLSGLGVKELTIFNRYGVKVYGYKNYTNQWKGQSDDGKELPDATYYYAISKSDGQTVTGWVYLNRQR
ncbi:gliding motility-associated C-terminal domain-containing protein [uncultured Flavobacterium sp.]|uniref:T9SS type B sorting domain-containing protein n=1 Tax=uncultured Flavobacterium sp. TaxID=165435 RepID=UPI0027E18A59|nr:gliding motility-associated C-terminal domain-containing protein [uncultured Flavobacterium sp.]